MDKDIDTLIAQAAQIEKAERAIEETRAVVQQRVQAFRAGMDGMLAQAKNALRPAVDPDFDPYAGLPYREFGNPASQE